MTRTRAAEAANPGTSDPAPTDPSRSTTSSEDSGSLPRADPGPAARIWRLSKIKKELELPPLINSEDSWRYFSRKFKFAVHDLEMDLPLNTISDPIKCSLIVDKMDSDLLDWFENLKRSKPTVDTNSAVLLQELEAKFANKNGPFYRIQAILQLISAGPNMLLASYNSKFNKCLLDTKALIPEELSTHMYVAGLPNVLQEPASHSGEGFGIDDSERRSESGEHPR